MRPESLQTRGRRKRKGQTINHRGINVFAWDTQSVLPTRKWNISLLYFLFLTLVVLSFQRKTSSSLYGLHEKLSDCFSFSPPEILAEIFWGVYFRILYYIPLIYFSILTPIPQGVWGGVVFWLRHLACRILVPQPGIEPRSMAVKAQGPNHWTAREFPWLKFLYPKCIIL